MADLYNITKIKTLIITVCWTEFHITYMADLYSITKIKTLIITICWTEFHITYIFRLKLSKIIINRIMLFYADEPYIKAYVL